MRKTIILTIACICFVVDANAQRGSGRLSLSAELLHKNGLDVMLAYEHETNYRHAWEFLANGYPQWAECESCKHVCPKSFQQNYRTYGFGVAYRPCVTKGHSYYGSPHTRASGGDDTGKFLVGLHFDYEHNYVLWAGWTLCWQIKGNVVVEGADVLRAGVALGTKLPIK